MDTRKSKTPPSVSDGSSQSTAGQPSFADMVGPDSIDNEETPTITDSELIQWVMECRRESYDARRTRIRLNNINRDAYMGIQDFSYKQKGQSTEFLPKTNIAAEQFGAFLKKALIQFGDWFAVKLSPEVKPYITEGQIRALLKLYLAQ